MFFLSVFSDSFSFSPPSDLVCSQELLTSSSFTVIPQLFDFFSYRFPSVLFFSILLRFFFPLSRVIPLRGLLNQRSSAFHTLFLSSAASSCFSKYLQIFSFLQCIFFPLFIFLKLTSFTHPSFLQHMGDINFTAVFLFLP